MLLSLACAVFTAIAYGTASVLEAVGAARTRKSTQALDPRLLLRLVRQWPYLAGLGLDSVGFAVSLVALNQLPLFLVESVIAASVGLTAILAAMFLKVRLHRIEITALVALIAGLTMLAVSAERERAAVLATAAEWTVLAGVAVVAVLAVAATRLGPRTGIALAALGGLSFSGLGVATRALEIPGQWWQLIGDPLSWAIAAYGLLGMLLFSSALQRVPVTTATALLFGTETLVPAVIGVIFLGDRARPGFGVLAVVGFAVALVAALVLALRAQPDESEMPAAAAEPG